MADWQAAERSSGDQGAALGEFAKGQALQLISDDVARLRRDGIILKGQLRIAPYVVGSDTQARTVMIGDCADTSNWLNYKAADGTPVGAGAGGKHRVTAHVVDDAGAWRVDQLTITAIGSCS